jgi:hypothetical protein
MKREIFSRFIKSIKEYIKEETIEGYINTMEIYLFIKSERLIKKSIFRKMIKIFLYFYLLKSDENYFDNLFTFFYNLFFNVIFN